MVYHSQSSVLEMNFLRMHLVLLVCVYVCVIGGIRELETFQQGFIWITLVINCVTYDYWKLLTLGTDLMA